MIKNSGWPFGILLWSSLCKHTKRISMSGSDIVISNHDSMFNKHTRLTFTNIISWFPIELLWCVKRVSKSFVSLGLNLYFLKKFGYSNQPVILYNLHRNLNFYNKSKICYKLHINEKLYIIHTFLMGTQRVLPNCTYHIKIS